jgi:diguanylate cyclase (GGDEF)-like protein
MAKQAWSGGLNREFQTGLLSGVHTGADLRLQMANMQMTGEEVTRAVWLGVRVTAGALAALIAFVLLPGHGTILLGPYMGLVGAATVLVVVVAWLPRRVVAGAHGPLVLYAWSLADVGLIAALVACTGGGRSPLFLLYALTCLFTASYPAAVQALVGAATASSYLAALAVTGCQVTPAQLTVRVASIGLLMMMAGFLARDKARSAAEATHRASLLGIVAAATRTLITLTPEEVLDGVTRAVTELGYESANISIIDEAAGTYRVTHAWGMPDEYVTATHPADIGMTGMVRQAQKTVAVGDYCTLADAVPMLAAAGFNSAIASPLWVDGRLAGVLIGGSKRHHQLGRDDIEAFELLASVAGQALETAHRYEQLAEREAQLERLNRRLVQDSRHDALTGMRNRRALAYDLPRIETAHRERGQTFAVAVCDVDHFKAYNDQLGHMAGDQALRAIAGIIRGQLRAEDVSYRFGGEELLVVLSNVSLGEAAEAAERIRAAVADAALPHPSGVNGVVTVSVGVAVGAHDATGLLAQADVALYAAKDAGRNQIVLANHEAGVDTRPDRKTDEPQPMRTPDTEAIIRAASRGQGAMPILEAMAEIIHLQLGFEIVAVNLRDFDHDHAQVVLALGDQDARQALLGLGTPWPDLEALIASGHQRHGASWLPAGTDHGNVQTYESAMPQEDEDPLAWNKDDMLLLPVNDSTGQTIALVSVDRPLSARRPSDEEVALLMAVCDQAGRVLEHTQPSAAAPAAGARPPELRLGAVMLLAETLDLRDPGTARHSHTVGHHARRIATALGLSPQHVERIHAAGVLHDLGKAAISDAILTKPGKLDQQEWGQIKRHPETGARILQQAGLTDIANWVHAHHERVDGLGYPDGLTHPQIPLEAKILAVADAYEAMTTDRPYRPGASPEHAQAELLRCTGTQFDPTVVKAFLSTLAHDPTSHDKLPAAA